MKKYHGIIVPVVTPLSDPFTVDLPAVKPLFDFIIGGGVSAIFVLGTTGEGPALSLDQQKKFILESKKAIAGRVPLLVGISGASGADTLEMGRFAVNAGADAIVAAVPCYIPAESDDEIFGFYSALAQEFPGKVFVYNMPAMVKVAFSPELAVRLLGIPGIAGYKDSSGVFEDFARVVKAAKPLGKHLFIGPEHLTKAAMEIGGDGGVNGGANILPELFARLVKAIDDGDTAAADQAQREIEAFQPQYGTPCTAPSVVRSLKYLLARKGLIQNITAFPNLPKSC